MKLYKISCAKMPTPPSLLSDRKQTVASCDFRAKNNSEILFSSKMEIIRPDVFLKEVNTDEFRNVLLNSVCEENFLGAGREAKAYKIDGYPNIVLRMPKATESLADCDLKFKHAKKIPTKYNYGQTIYNTDDRIEIKEFVKGKIVSCIDIPHRILSKEKLSSEDAMKNLEFLRIYANFPMHSYIDLANKVKFLHNTPQTIDYLGSGNILADTDKKEFNIIDLWDKGKYGNTGEAGFANICALLCDGALSEETHEALGYDEEYCALVKKVIEKSAKASKITSLPYAKEELLRVITNANDLTLKHANINCEFPRRYDWFFNRYDI